MNKYDAIVIGSGNGGLMAGAKLVKEGFKVLVIEQHNVPGGFASSFVRGRFEFEPALHELGAVGDKNNKGYVYEMFEELGINIEWNSVPEAFTLVIGEGENQQIYSLPFGKEEFAKKMDEYDPGSYQKVINFLDICDEIYDCIAFIEENKGNVDTKVIRKKFPNYTSTGSYTLEEVLDKMEMSVKAKNILCAYWVYLGLPAKELDFTLYAIMFSEYIRFGAWIPSYRSHEMSNALATYITKNGGSMMLNTKVNKILVQDGKVTGVSTTNGVFNSDYVLCNCSPLTAYSELIDNDEVPSYDRKLTSMRKLNSQGFSFYLGLNIDASQLKLKDYSYFMFSDLDNNKCFQNLNSIDTNLEYVVVILNNANPKASEKNTCILSFTTLYNDAWNNVDDIDYFNVKEKIAERMIRDFERRMNVEIFKYIEEIEIATPVTFARYTGSKNGVIYGYAPNKKDSTIVRSKNMDRDCNIKGLRFVGGFGYRTHGYSTTYRSGYIMARKTVGDIKKSMREGK